MPAGNKRKEGGKVTGTDVLNTEVEHIASFLQDIRKHRIENQIYWNK